MHQLCPFTINNGYEMRAWFDILEPNLGSQFDFAGVEKSLSQMKNSFSMKSPKTTFYLQYHVSRFSQGAVIALASALLHHEKLAGGYCPVWIVTTC